ncbi:MAG: ABC transporter permease [Acidimicrobiia bacterium]|nr:ABC transporter permease [Acidimicrobiia bacterium]
MTEFLAFTVTGIVTGAVYAVAASGLVVTYTTSGIFNFAHGAMGMLMAFLYWQLRVHFHWAAPFALIAVLFVAAPLFGAIIERVLMRNVRGSDTGTALMVTLGLLLFLIGLALTWWKPTEPRALPEFFAGHSVRIFSVNVTWHELISIAVAGGVAVLLRLLLYRTRVGIAMRAVVDDRDLTALNGGRPSRVSALSWAIGTMLAALAGILLAPKLSLDVFNLTFLVISAYAAAIVGQLKSLPLTFLGALALGLGEAYAVGYLPTSGFLSHIKPSLPMLFLFAVLLFLPQVRLRVGRVVGSRAPRVPSWRQVGAASVVFVVATWIIASSLHTTALAELGAGLAFAIIMLSLVLLAGYGGQTSLCQMAFVGIGAVVAAKISHGSSPVGLLAAAGAAGAVGAVISLPALRLSGLYLALSTLAFAVLADNLFFLQVFGGGGALTMHRLSVLGLNVNGDVAYTVLLAVAFVLMGAFVIAIRRGPFGRLLSAMKDSPAACATLGLDLTRTKVGVFALSAAMAGIGGVLLGGLGGSISSMAFIYIQSLVVLLMVTIGGIMTVSGALLGGLLLGPGFYIIQQHINIENLTFLGAGLGAMTIARSPNGIVGQLSGLVDRFRRQPVEPEAGGLPDVDVTEEVERVAAPVG